MSDIEELKLAAEFPATNREQWLALVARVLKGAPGVTGDAGRGTVIVLHRGFRVWKYVRPDAGRLNDQRIYLSVNLEAACRHSRADRQSALAQSKAYLGRRTTASIVSLRAQTTLTRSLSPNSWPIELCARKAWPCMKQVAGFPDSTGRRITAVALSRVQSLRSGVTAIEQTKTSAVSIASSIESWLV